jgi:hypothetical protein
LDKSAPQNSMCICKYVYICNIRSILDNTLGFLGISVTISNHLTKSAFICKFRGETVL